MRAVVILIIITAVAGLAEQPAIAIVDLEAKRCGQDLADACSDILRTEIINTGKFRVIERAQLARVMEEHAFQLSGLVDASTVAELGKLVGADFVALGSLSVIGGTYTISLRFISVETAEATLGKTETTSSESGLPDVCRRLAGEFASAAYGIGPSTSSGGYSDSDRDGVPDNKDMCPDEPETINGYQDEDGCPDGQPSTQSTPRVIRLEAIFFEPNSTKIVTPYVDKIKNIVRVLQEFPTIMIKITGHTSNQGEASFLQHLSVDRAQAVADILVDIWGISSSRLEVVGLGCDAPIAQNNTQEGRAQNDRVEFSVK
ncbi:MAG TPA: OmpA family protein [bacterium]|nr:OmpA family protein [bacterium]